MAGQAANNGNNQAAGQKFVKFTRPAAQRIAKVVRTVEAGDRGQPGLRFDHPMPTGAGRIFRVCTFTGTWSKNTSKTVTFRNITATPNTAVAENIFVTVGTTATTVRNCAIAKDGTAWYLIAAECSGDPPA
jgi:hypothetical protein